MLNVGIREDKIKNSPWDFDLSYKLECKISDSDGICMRKSKLTKYTDENVIWNWTGLSYLRKFWLKWIWSKDLGMQFCMGYHVEGVDLQKILICKLYSVSWNWYYQLSILSIVKM